MATDLARTSAQQVEVQEDRLWSLRLIQLKLVNSALHLVHLCGPAGFLVPVTGYAQYTQQGICTGVFSKLILGG